MKHYKIDFSKPREVSDVLVELSAIETPCAINIYDRVFMLDTPEELHVFRYGLEIGSYIAMDKKEKEKC